MVQKGLIIGTKIKQDRRYFDHKACNGKKSSESSSKKFIKNFIKKIGQKIVKNFIKKYIKNIIKKNHRYHRYEK